MDNELTSLITIFTEFYYWVTVVFMFLIHVGFCMYEVGASRYKNHTHTLMKNTMLIPLVTITFFFFGWWIYFAFVNGPWISGPLVDAPWATFFMKGSTSRPKILNSAPWSLPSSVVITPGCKAWATMPLSPCRRLSSRANIRFMSFESP